MGELEEIVVSKGITKQVSEDSWIKAEYSIKAKVNTVEELNAAKSMLELMIDKWLQEIIKENSKVSTVVPENLSDLRWVEKEGPAGKYEQCSDTNNPKFQMLLKELKEHNGKMVKDGYFYWIFNKGYIGRKKRE